jgi:hypothetical protein
MIPRKHHRYVIEFPVSFNGDHEGDGMVTNLSIGGCHVEKADVTVDEKAMVKLRLYVAFRDLPVKIDAARVRWSTGNDFGVEFMSIEETEEQRLQRYISQLPL